MREDIGIVLCITLIVFMYLYSKEWNKEPFRSPGRNYNSVNELKDAITELYHYLLNHKIIVNNARARQGKLSDNVINVLTPTTIKNHYDTVVKLTNNIITHRRKWSSDTWNPNVIDVNVYIDYFNSALDIYIKKYREKHNWFKKIPMIALTQTYYS